MDANTRPYYLRADLNLSDACVVAPIDGGEDYSGDGLGLDNDGDLLYDGNDPDCEAPECTVDVDCDDCVDCTVDTCDMVSGKVTVCHRPPGNPAQAPTLSINAVSVAAHLAHGDLLGPCP